MELSQIVTNALFEHPKLGVGQITSVDKEGPRVYIKFDNDQEKDISKSEVATREYRALPEDGLEASFRKDPELVRSWANNAPLRLIGTTLKDLPEKKGKAGDLRVRLEGRVIQGVTWDTWWQKNARKSATESGYFHMGKGNDPMELIVPIEEITNEPPPRPAAKPAQSKKSTAKTSRTSRTSADRDLPDWIQWLWAEEYTSPPGAAPPDSLIKLLEHWPSEILPRAVHRLTAGAEEAQKGTALSGRTASQWLGSIVKAQARMIDGQDPDVSFGAARKTPRLLAQLTAGIKERDRSPGLVAEAANLIRRRSLERRGFAAGIWDTYKEDTSTAEALLSQLSAQLDVRHQAALWGDLATVALADNTSVPGMNRLLGLAKPEVQTQAMMQLILRTAQGDLFAPGTYNFITSSRLVEKFIPPEDRLSLQLTAALLLKGGDSLDEAQKAFERALDAQQLEPELGVAPTWIKLVREKIREAVELEESNRKEDQTYYEKQLDQKSEEIAGLKQREKGLRAGLVADKADADLETRRDMLLRFGGLMQRAYRKDTPPGDLIEEMRSIMPNVLKAGDAEPLGKAGDVVEYDSRFHHSPQQVATGQLVELAAPGVIVRDLPRGDAIILKATVALISEEN